MIFLAMTFQEIQARALEIRKAYEAYEIEKYGKNWTREQVAEGLVGDVGDLMKLIQAKSGIRNIEDVDEKLAHELSDCLWCIIVLANKYDVALEDAFIKTMSELETRIRGK